MRISDWVQTCALPILTVDWPAAQGERAQLVLSRDPGKPLIEAIAIAGKTVLGGIDPAGVVTVGTRDLKQGWTIFFDNPRKRPFESFPLTLARSDIDVRAEGGYTKVIVGGAAAGPFSRSEGRRVGEGCGRRGRSRWSPFH